jgi:sugar lactone lactonase YvrE
MMFECPRWHDGRWYITDIFRPAIVTLREDGSDVRNHAVFEQKVSGTGWLPDGSLLVVAIEERRLLRVQTSGEVLDYAFVGDLGRGLANDLVVDAQGYAFVGLIGYEIGQVETGGPAPAGVVVRVDPGGGAAVVAEGLLAPNGMVITRDGRTLVVGESLGSRYTAFTIDPDGTVSEGRVWAQLGGYRDGKSAPDGCSMDTDGRIWFADSASSRFVLVEEGGREVEEIRLPEPLNAYACMLGGADGRTLAMCCGPGHSARDRTSAQHVVLTTRVEAPHAGLP